MIRKLWYAFLVALALSIAAALARAGDCETDGVVEAIPGAVFQKLT